MILRRQTLFALLVALAGLLARAGASVVLANIRRVALVGWDDAAQRLVSAYTVAELSLPSTSSQAVTERGEPATMHCPRACSALLLRRGVGCQLRWEPAARGICASWGCSSRLAFCNK